MRVTSRKNASTRERTDVAFDCVPVARWNIEWVPADNGMVRAAGRTLLLHSTFGSDRDYELHLSESEAVAVAKAVLDGLLSTAVKQGEKP